MATRKRKPKQPPKYRDDHCGKSGERCPREAPCLIHYRSFAVKSCRHDLWYRPLEDEVQ